MEIKVKLNQEEITDLLNKKKEEILKILKMEIHGLPEEPLKYFILDLLLFSDLDYYTSLGILEDIKQQLVHLEMIDIEKGD